MADRRLHALAEAFDDLDRPLQIRMRHAPHAAAQRLLDALGALVVIDLSAPPCAERCNHKECRMTAIAFEPNWISYRHSLVQVDKRRDADDDTLEICAHCECEVDVAPAPHKPGCRGIGAPRANSATSVSPPMVRKPAAAAKPAARAAVSREPEGLDLLEAMDADEPLTPDEEDDDELELDEEAAAERLGPDGTASSSSPVLQEEEVAAVGDLTGSGSADRRSSSEPERAATPSNVNPYGLKKMGRGYIWTKEAALQSVRDFADANDHPPSLKDARDLPAGTLPSSMTAKELFGSWADLIEQAGFARPTKATNYSKPTVSEREPKGAATTAARAVTSAPATDGEEPASRSETVGWIKVKDTGLAYRNSMEAYVAADEIEADGERVAKACRDDGNEERADQAVDQSRELAEKIRAAARAADESGPAIAAAPSVPEPRDENERDARAVDASPPSVPPSAPASGPDGAKHEERGEIRLLVSPAEMDGFQRALALAAIAGARAFADTLEQELAA